MKIEKTVGLIAWTPLMLVAFLTVHMPFLDFSNHYFSQFDCTTWHYTNNSVFVNVIGYIVLISAAVMITVGESILARYGDGASKLWKYLAIWYATYVVFTISIIVLVVFIFNAFFDILIILFTIALCLYPLFALLLLAAVMLCMKLLRKDK